MYLLLILLVSPAFGRPSSDQLDVGGDISNELDIFTKFNNKTAKLFVNSSVINDVVKTLQGAEDSMIEMTIELKTLEFKEIQFEDNVFPEFYKAKSYVRETRQELRKLARRTVTDVRDVKILLGGLDKTNDSVLLKISIKRLVDLMIKTLETLKLAKEKYNSAVETFETVNSIFKAQHFQLEKLTVEACVSYFNTEFDEERLFNLLDVLEIDVKTTNISEICGDKSTKQKIFKVFDTITLTFGGIDMPVATYESLESITDRMLDRGDNFEKIILEAIKIVTGEIELMGIWTEGAKNVNANIDQYPEEYLRKIKSVRDIFISGLDDLKNAAEKFLALPKDDK